MNFISATEEQKQKSPEEEKAQPWSPPSQHNFLKNWQRNLTLRKRQQEALSERLKKPVSQLLMHIGETYRQIQEERELIDRTLPTQHDGKKHIGIAVRLTFETLEGQKTSSELTVVNNGTVAILYDWRRRSQLDSFQELKRNRMERFYFNNREGVILPGETKTFTFFFKSLNAGIFRECWEFGTHPTLLGGAVLQVNLYAVSLAQDIFRSERKLLEDRLNSKKHKAKDDKKLVKSFSRDRFSLEDPIPESTTPFQEPMDPLVMEKYTQRLYTQVYELLDTLVTDLMALADELSPIKNVEESFRLCT
ncbi:MYCBP-associated protein [Pteropus alecto]|uniref:MYCBP-associated protein n=1 Tax=Pteropus alecto TaxID=9402 RepID=L5JRV7_PTEAL|nr:MYCBP-associated protein [Pteropus alecto]